MVNQDTFNISTPQGQHQVVLQQSPDGITSINSFLDGAAHPMTECRASANGTTFKGNTIIRIFFFPMSDVISVSVDPAADAVSMTVSGANLTFAGTMGKGEGYKLVAFIKGLGLPSLADA